MNAIAIKTHMRLFTPQYRVTRDEDRDHSSRGFSLLELCIVLSIVIVTTAIAVPTVKSTMNAYVVNSAVTSLTGAVQTTRYRAISTGYPFSLVINKAASTYQVQSDPTITGTFANVGNAIPFSTTLNLLNQDTTLVFRPGGAVCLQTSIPCVCAQNASGSCTMTITYSNIPQELITVSPYGQTSVTP